MGQGFKAHLFVIKTFAEASFHLCLVAFTNYIFSILGDRPAMPRESICKPRQIIDRKARKAELEALVAWSGYTPKIQDKVLDIYKRVYRSGWDEIRRRFEAREAGGPESK